MWFLLGLSVVLGLLYLISGILLPFTLGFVLAYFLDPIADKFERFGFSRGIASFFILLLFFAVVVILFVVLGPIIYKQLLDLIKALPTLFDFVISQLMIVVTNLAGFFDLNLADFDVNTIKTDLLKKVSVFAVDNSKGIATNILESSFVVANIMGLLLITPIVSFYLLCDWDKILNKLYHLFPHKYRKSTLSLMKSIDNVISGYLRGQINVCLILSGLYASGLTLVGLKYGLLIGFISGILTFIPYIGILLSTIIGVVLAYVHFDGNMMRVSLVLAVFLLGQFIEGNFITPRLVGDKVGLHPVWVIFSLLAGGSLFGFAGILLAIPVGASIGVVVRHSILYYVQTPYYTQLGSKGKSLSKQEMSDNNIHDENNDYDLSSAEIFGCSIKPKSKQINSILLPNTAKKNNNQDNTNNQYSEEEEDIDTDSKIKGLTDDYYDQYIQNHSKKKS